MYSIFGLTRGLFRNLSVSRRAQRAEPVQSPAKALMEEAEACAGTDLHNAQELRRAAMAALGVSR